VAIIYLCVTSTHFHDVEFVISFICWRSIAAQGYFPLPIWECTSPPWTHKWHHLVSHSHTSQVRSPCSMKRTKVTHLWWGLPTINDTWKAHMDVADPQVATCIRSDHRQAIHLL
jgi:hypothetical protein